MRESDGLGKLLVLLAAKSLAVTNAGRAGALIIGHDTGGLGKMPGFYYKESLDSVHGMASR